MTDIRFRIGLVWIAFFCLGAIACLVSLSPAADSSKAGGSPARPEIRDRTSEIRDLAPAPIAVADPVENYLGRRGRHFYGSCFHAAVEDLLRADGLDEQASYWRRHFDGPADLEEICRIADSLGLRHAETEAGDERFLEYCTAHRLGAAISWEVEEPGDHAIVFCGFNGREAVLLGVNRPEITRLERNEFLRRWRHCGGFAFTIVTGSARSAGRGENGRFARARLLRPIMPLSFVPLNLEFSE